MDCYFLIKNIGAEHLLYPFKKQAKYMNQVLETWTKMTMSESFMPVINFYQNVCKKELFR